MGNPVPSQSGYDRKDQLTNFTESLNELYQENTIQVRRLSSTRSKTEMVNIAGHRTGLGVASRLWRQERQDQAHQIHQGELYLYQLQNQ